MARFAILPALLGTAGAMLIASTASAQLFTTTASTANWDSARWSTNPVGPYSSAWVAGSSASFSTAGNYTFANLYGSGTAQLLVGNITTGSGANVGFTTSSGKNLNFTSNATTVDTGANSFVNFGGANVGGANSVTKTGVGVLALNGASTTYSGGLTINGGTVIATSVNSLGGNAGTGALTIGSNGGTIGSGLVTGVNVTTKNFATRFSGINLNGDLQLGTTGTWASNSDAASMSFGNSVALTGGTRTITLGSSGTQTFSGIISGVSLLKVAAIGTGTAGTLALSGNNTYSGGTEINGAILQVSGNDTVLGTGATTLTGTDPAELKIEGGGLTLANSVSIANSTGVKTISATGGSSTMSGNIVSAETDNGQFILGSDGGTLTVSGAISGAGGLRIGSASLNGTVELSGNNTYSGLTSIDTGTLLISSANAIPTGATAELELVNNGTLDLNGNSVTFKSITGASGAVVTNFGTSTLTLGASDTTSTLSAAIGDGSANLSLIKTGTGSLTLASTFNSEGTATINAGKVILTNQGFLGGMVVNAGATVAGSESLGLNLTVTGATIDLVGTGTAVPQSMGAANITISGSTSTTLMQIASDTSASSLNSSGNLVYNGNLVLRYDATTVSAVGTTWNLFTFSNIPTGNFANISVAAGAGEFSGVSFTYDATRGNWYSTNPTGSFSPSDHYLVFTPSAGSLVIVPEPSTWAMTLASVGFAGWMARRKKLASKKQLAA